MVSLTEVKTLNAKAAEVLPPNLVAVFAGATSGIGEASLKAFAKHTVRPKVYFIGRSQESGDRVKTELNRLNPDGEYIFVKADMSLLKTVDDVCNNIKKKETFINVLFLSQGTLKMGVDTSEGLPLSAAVALYARMRIVTNLLPLVRQAPSLRRVITVMSATYEDKAYLDDVACRKVSMGDVKGHLATIMTLSLQALAPQAPEVSFIHCYPGAVDTNLIRSDDGMMMQAAKYYFKVSMTVRRKFVSLEECGERHAFLCLNERYASKERGDDSRLANGGKAAMGVDGKSGSGVYSINCDGESAPEKVVELLKKYRAEGAIEKVWGNIEGEFKRITGTASV